MPAELPHDQPHTLDLIIRGYGRTPWLKGCVAQVGVTDYIDVVAATTLLLARFVDLFIGVVFDITLLGQHSRGLGCLKPLQCDFPRLRCPRQKGAPGNSSFRHSSSFRWSQGSYCIVCVICHLFITPD